MGNTGETRGDRDQLVELLARYASIPDTNDWVDLPADVFASDVRWDLEQVSGEPPATFQRDEVMAHLSEVFAVFSATHHAITNHRVEVSGDMATIRAHMRAEHWLRRDLIPSGGQSLAGGRLLRR